MKKVLSLAVLLAVAFLLPCLAQAQEHGKANTWKIAICPGHGPNTPGKRSAPFTKEVTHTFQGHTVTVKPGEQFREHTANRGISYWQAKILEDMGFQVKRFEFIDLTTSTPEIHDLSVRQNMFREWGANISVENHYNAFGDGQTFNSAKGICTYSHSDAGEARDSMTLAKLVQNHLAKTFNQQNRHTPTANFAMCRCKRTGCQASILIEHAFMTNEQEAIDYFCNPEAWYNYAIATCKGICEYTGVKYTGPEPTTESGKADKAAEPGAGPSLPAGVKAKKGTITAGKSGLLRRAAAGSDQRVGAINYGDSARVIGVTEDGKWFYLNDGSYVNASPSAGTFKAD